VLLSGSTLQARIQLPDQFLLPAFVELRTVFDVCVSRHNFLPSSPPVETRILETKEQTMPRVAATIRSNHTSDGAVVLDIHGGQMFRLNPVGSRILEGLKNGLAVPQIAMEISEAFGISLATAEMDLRDFLKNLERHNIIEPRTSSGSL
jgi:hypothetical protein